VLVRLGREVGMMEKKDLIQRIVNVFETGKPEGDYGAVSVLPDGGNGSLQITYGRSQTTEQSGGLLKLLRMYIEAGGRHADGCQAFVDVLADGGGILLRSARFQGTLRLMGSDPIMRDVQDEFFDKHYWNPAVRWFEKHDFVFPLSMLVVYDSYIHSGGVPMYLRRRFRVTPDDEMEWVERYVETRHQWLKHHRKKILRNTIYRTKTFLNELARENWDLNRLPIVAHGIAVR